MIALIIPIIIGLTYILANKEKGNLVEYQKSSNYEFAKLSHGLTAYKQFGSKDNTPIIVIHGATLPSEGFIGFCEGLGQKGYWVICYDQYGRGFSDRPKIKYDMNLYVTQLNELINYLSIDNTILYGTSMGAPIAVSYSNKYPNTILAVGLQVPLVHIKNTMSSIMKIPFVGNILFRFFGIPFIKNRALEWPSVNESQKVFIERYIEQLTLPGTEQSILSSLRNVGSKDFYPSYLNFSKLNIPVHISYSNDDDEIDPASVRRVLEVTPHAESFIFSGGHGGGAKIVPEIINLFTKFLAQNLN
tara:strand:+ start:549 stop:1454 length:906 start_codon:yes stop_codon:yes gene_type:complete